MSLFRVYYYYCYYYTSMVTTVRRPRQLERVCVCVCVYCLRMCHSPSPANKISHCYYYRGATRCSVGATVQRVVVRLSCPAVKSLSPPPPPPPPPQSRIVLLLLHNCCCPVPVEDIVASTRSRCTGDRAKGMKIKHANNVGEW